jgi:Cu(I)/Ag(I) efflux system membrane fusion protein
MESEGRTEIRKGLEAGQKIVVSGQFLIDSEASLRGTATRMSAAPAAQGGTSGSQTHRAQGKIERIGKDAVTISHDAIPSLEWEPMTMDFGLPANGLPGDFAVGDTVTFEIRENKQGMFEIATITPIARAPAHPGHGEGDVPGTAK